MSNMRQRAGLILFAVVTTTVCAQAESGARMIDTQSGRITVEELASGLDHPWGMAFLPDGRLLVTERAGRLRILGIDNQVSPPLSGTPEVDAGGQGGLLDIALDPAFATNRTIFLSFAEPGGDGVSTALARATLGDKALTGLKVIFSQTPKVSGSGHFGGRIVFSPSGHLFFTMGDRQKFEPAQSLSSHLGKIVRLNRDGTIPNDNPFVGRAGGLPQIWSYGHRNVQGAAFEPLTGVLWTNEFGPRGGDELNRPEAGKNYGWPLVSWGNHYDGRDIPDPPSKPDFVDALAHWTPVISPSGMIFYTGAKFPMWRGDILIAGLSSQGLVRVQVKGAKASEAERISLGERIRDVEQAPDGSIYVLTDESNGKVLRLRPHR